MAVLLTVSRADRGRLCTAPVLLAMSKDEDSPIQWLCCRRCPRADRGRLYTVVVLLTVSREDRGRPFYTVAALLLVFSRKKRCPCPCTAAINTCTRYGKRCKENMIDAHCRKYLYKIR